MGKVLTNRSYSRELECVKLFRGIYYIPSSASAAFPSLCSPVSGNQGWRRALAGEREDSAPQRDLRDLPKTLPEGKGKKGSGKKDFSHRYHPAHRVSPTVVQEDNEARMSCRHPLLLAGLFPSSFPPQTPPLWRPHDRAPTGEGPEAPRGAGAAGAGGGAPPSPLAPPAPAVPRSRFPCQRVEMLTTAKREA